VQQRARRLNPKNGDLLPKIEPLPGALLGNQVRCGKPTCRCVHGALHGPYLYRRWREHGRQRRQYVRPANLEQVREAIDVWHDLHPPVSRTKQALADLRRLLRVAHV
jgi:hypothetical protein